MNCNGPVQLLNECYFDLLLISVISGATLPTRVTVNPDRTFSIQFNSPIGSWLIKRAAGIRRGAMKSGGAFVSQILLKPKPKPKPRLCDM